MDQIHVNFSKLASLTARPWTWNDWKTILSFWDDQSSGALLVSGSVSLIRAVNRFMSTELPKSHLTCLNNPPGHHFFQNLLLNCCYSFLCISTCRSAENCHMTHFPPQYPTLPKHTAPVVIGPCHLLQTLALLSRGHWGCTKKEAWHCCPLQKVTVFWNTYKMEQLTNYTNLKIQYGYGYPNDFLSQPENDGFSFPSTWFSTMSNFRGVASGKLT